MEQKQFDKTIKESLEHLKVSFDASPWDKIEQSLDALDVPTMPLAENDFDNQFDKTIKESLGHLEVSFDASPWDKIEQSLDALDVPAMPLTENDFDVFISGKLENLSVPAKQPNWERMSAALDKAETSTVFDEKVKSKIDTINPVYQASHWELLAAQSVSYTHLTLPTILLV